MVLGIEGIIWYILLIDSIGAIITTLFFVSWYKKNARWWNKHFPATLGWSIWYLILVLWVGYGLLRLCLLG